MSILDRVTKAVGDAVDRGKKEVDQFVRIQKINGQIGDLEKSIEGSKGQIQQAKLKIGEMAIEMMRAGTLNSQEMKEVLDQIAGFEQQIAARETEIVQKRAEIESIRSEEKMSKPPQTGADAPPIPSPPPGASRFCPHCGVPAGSGAFCAQCGSKLG